MCRDSCVSEVSDQTLSGNVQGEICMCVGRHGQVYDEDGRLTHVSLENPGSMALITECNMRCTCPNTCRNRVVQKGIRYKLEVSKHVQKGLCLQTLECIKQLTFICEYAGEVLSYEEAKHRALQQTKTDMNYIFVLREHFSSGPLVTYVDPCKRGNIGRFINHSCTPNAFIVPVRVENMVPKLCVFARRDISPGEEITYDYGSVGMDGAGADTKDAAPASDSVCMNVCHCMSENCKGVLPYDPTLFPVTKTA